MNRLNASAPKEGLRSETETAATNAENTEIDISNISTATTQLPISRKISLTAKLFL
jgi:hypothetical protein